jgi:hypothetical protein
MHGGSAGLQRWREYRQRICRQIAALRATQNLSRRKRLATAAGHRALIVDDTPMPPKAWRRSCELTARTRIA